MRYRTARVWIIAVLAASPVGCDWDSSPRRLASLEPPTPTPQSQHTEALELFESRIRPTLSQHCYGCHGPSRQASGLRLDSRADLMKGAKSGPIVVPGDPERSRLMAVLRHDGDVQMPPPGKLADASIEAFADWIRMGAPWPLARSGSMSLANPESIAEARRSHWAFQPVRAPQIPDLSDPSWARSSIDHFILAALEDRGLTASDRADPWRLLRRVSFDLVGLPPSPDDMAEFARDPSHEALEGYVNRLLDSPRFGEKWARHWLDVARYADTKGYVYDGEDRRYVFAHSYRDYVVRAFNDDLPYDQFLKQQIAADRLPSEPDRESLAALGFLTLGRRFTNNVHDVVDDRLDVIFRGTQALTVTCARCHDHKLEPIPTRDYYSLYGVLAGTVERTVPIGPPPTATPEYESYASELGGRVEERNRLLEWHRQRLCDRLRGQVTEYLLGVLDAESQPGDDFYMVLAADDINPRIVRRWQSYLMRQHGAEDPIFGPWHAFAALPADRFPQLARQLGEAARGATGLNPLVAELFRQRAPKSMREVATRYGKLLESAHSAWQQELEAAKLHEREPPEALADPALEQLRQTLYALDSPTTVPSAAIHQIESYFDQEARLALHRAQARIDELRAESPATPPHAHTLEDPAVPFTPHVFLQGNPKLKGDIVPKQFLEVLAGPDRRPFQPGNERLELAQYIAHADNPLTARVLVNRVWRQLFGSGLVATPSNFGLSGEPPSHPELLDYLAWQFVEDGWSVKKLLRHIVLSSVYQQDSSHRPDAAQRDPQNRWLWRMNRRPLEFEALRDSLLVAADRLDTTMGGRTTAQVDSPDYVRRTVYARIDRQNLPSVLRVFDFANPDTHSPMRHQTTVPQQALYFLNSPFVVEMARQLATRVENLDAANVQSRIEHLYQLVYQRLPSDRELAVAEEFLTGSTQTAGGDIACAPDDSSDIWQHYAQVLLMANEFVFLD